MSHTGTKKSVPKTQLSATIQ